MSSEGKMRGATAPAVTTGAGVDSVRVEEQP